MSAFVSALIVAALLAPLDGACLMYGLNHLGVHRSYWQCILAGWFLTAFLKRPAMEREL